VWPTSLLVEAEWRRRNEAVGAVRMYCNVLEGGPRLGRRKRTVSIEDVEMNDSPAVDQSPPPSSLPRDEALLEADEDIRTACKLRYASNAMGMRI
jgi:hypothetical protein